MEKIEMNEVTYRISVDYKKYGNYNFWLNTKSQDFLDLLETSQNFLHWFAVKYSEEFGFDGSEVVYSVFGKMVEFDPNRKNVDEEYLWILVWQKCHKASKNNPQLGEEFAQFYKKLLENLEGVQNSLVIQAIATLNLKLVPAGVQTGKISMAEAPWLPDFGVEGATQQQKDLWREVNKFLYSTEFNMPRDFLRRALKIEFPEWSCEHLEVFADQDLFPRNEGENSGKSRMRHLIAGTIPHKETFLAMVNAKTMADFEKAVSGAVAPLIDLEAIFVSVSPKEIGQASNQAKWLKGINAQVPLRVEKVKRLREMRDLMPGFGWDK